MANTTVPAELINTATPLGRRNILINGDYSVYQRAQQATGLGASSGYFTADRWHIDTGNSAGRLTMTAGTEAAPAESNVTTSMKLDCTTADTSIAATEYLILNQKIEGQNVQHVKKGTSGAKQLTASFWVKSETTSHTFVVELYDVDNTRHVAKTFAVTSSWSKIELTFPADTTGAFGNDANNSLVMNIWLHAGSNFTSGTLASTWASVTAANRAAGVDSFYSSTSNELYITAVQLEVGDTATEFEILTKGEKEKLCHRYYQKYAYGDVASGTSDAGIFNGSQWSTTLFYGMFYFPRGETRPAPTITLDATDGLKIFLGGETSDSTSLDFTDRTSYGVEFTIGTSSMTVGKGGWARFNNGHYLEIDAEL
jgi:hypothetical protein